MKSTVVDISYANDLIVPVEEDMRDSIPSDPLFVMEVLHEAGKSDWEVALERHFKKPLDPEVQEARLEFLRESMRQAEELNA